MTHADLKDHMGEYGLRMSVHGRKTTGEPKELQSHGEEIDESTADAEALRAEIRRQRGVIAQLKNK